MQDGDKTRDELIDELTAARRRISALERAETERKRLAEQFHLLRLSGYNEQDATDRFAGKGLAGFVHKPFRVQLLIGTAREVMESE